mmetsp:Transcript_1715/g.5054  ORF Transcript_1715/g.5054 Transcript_1715/m.5054 type:complete len:204 (-) Transcript_1715:78-689(-)
MSMLGFSTHRCAAGRSSCTSTGASWFRSSSRRLLPTLERGALSGPVGAVSLFAEGPSTDEVTRDGKVRASRDVGEGRERGDDVEGETFTAIAEVVVRGWGSFGAGGSGLLEAAGTMQEAALGVPPDGRGSGTGISRSDGVAVAGDMHTGVSKGLCLGAKAEEEQVCVEDSRAGPLRPVGPVRRPRFDSTRIAGFLSPAEVEAP